MFFFSDTEFSETQTNFSKLPLKNGLCKHLSVSWIHPFLQHHWIGCKDRELVSREGVSKMLGGCRKCVYLKYENKLQVVFHCTLRYGMKCSLTELIEAGNKNAKNHLAYCL